jgi:hypothetical protein
MNFAASISAWGDELVGLSFFVRQSRRTMGMRTQCPELAAGAGWVAPFDCFAFVPEGDAFKSRIAPTVTMPRHCASRAAKYFWGFHIVGL